MTARAAAVAAALAPAALVTALAWADGGYFPSAWGVCLAGAGLAALAVGALGGAARPTTRGVAFVALLLSLATWTGLSALWSRADGAAILDAERVLLYASLAGVALVLLRPATVPALAAGLVAATAAVAGYGLATRLYPGDVGGAYDPSSGYQLIEPIGYSNALGILLVLGAVLAAGLARVSGLALRSAAAAALVPLAVALSFTFSRGALIALVVALVAAVALDPRSRRALLETAVLAAAPVAAAWLASRPRALNEPGATLQTAQEQGHALGWQLLALAVAAALVASVLPTLARRRGAVRAGSLLLGAAIAAAALAGAAATFARGGPARIVGDAVDSFRAESAVDQGDLRGRLLTASGNGRADYWRVAAGMVEENPLLGAGAATFERHWVERRQAANHARDAHNLYLETLAELGAVGLALLLAALVLPLGDLRRARRYPLGASLAAAYVAFLVHAAFDWDWEIPAVTLAALACAVSLLVLGRAAPAPEALRRGGSGALVGAGCAVLVVAVVAHVGNRAAEASSEALASGDALAAARHARTARTWQPWSAQPWQLLGEAQLALARDVEARRSLEEAVARDPGEWSAWLSLAAVPPPSDAALDRAEALNPLAVEVRELRTGVRTDS